MRTSRNIVWSDPRAEQCMPESNEVGRDEYNKIANDLAGKIADMIGNNHQDKQIITKLISSAITEQIRQYLREYDNVVAEDILNSLKGWKLGEIKGWQAEVDFEYARHGKLSAFGDELAKHFKRLQDESALHRVKEKILQLNPEPDSVTENNDGKIWLSNVLTIIDEELNGAKKEEPAPETTQDASEVMKEEYKKSDFKTIGDGN